MGVYTFTASEVLFGLDPQAYAAECKTFRAEAFEVIDEEPLEEAGGARA